VGEKQLRKDNLWALRWLKRTTFAQLFLSILASRHTPEIGTHLSGGEQGGQAAQEF